MITRAYYESGPITAAINVKSLVDSKPAVYILYISHAVNGILFNQELPTAEKAFTKASTFGCVRNLWKVYQVETITVDSGE